MGETQGTNGRGYQPQEIHRLMTRGERLTEDVKGGAVNDVFATILTTVTQGFAGSGRGAGLPVAPLLEAVSDVVAVAARDALERGGDLAPAAKAIIMGVVRGSGATNEAALGILAHAATVIIQQVARRNGNLAAAIKGIVLGAIASARTMGVEPVRAASTAAQGALAGASEAGSVTVERVLAAALPT